MIISILRDDFSSYISAPIIWTRNTTNIKKGNIRVGNTVPIIVSILSSVDFLSSSNIILSIFILLDIFCNSIGSIFEYLSP